MVGLSGRGVVSLMSLKNRDTDDNRRYWDHVEQTAQNVALRNYSAVVLGKPSRARTIQQILLDHRCELSIDGGERIRIARILDENLSS